MPKFIIFAHPRSGSTSLARVLGEISGVKMCIEPFHPNFSNWNPGEKNYHNLIKDLESLDKALAEIFEKYTAMKVLSYQFPKNIYFSMLSHTEYKILFLRRKNLFYAALSNLIAEQTKEWHKSDNPYLYERLKPIPILKVKNWTEKVEKTNNTFSEYLEKNRKGDYLSLYYEDLYSENMNDNTKELQKTCDFLNLPLPPFEEIEKFMSPSKSKINVNDLYKKLPNYEKLFNYFSK